MDESQRRSLGVVVKTLREAQGLSREELVAKTHDDVDERISLEMLAKVEQGRRAPSAKTLRKLAHALGIEPTTLVSSAAAWEAGDASGTHVAALRSHILGGGMTRQGGMTTQGRVLNSTLTPWDMVSQPARYGAAVLAGSLIGVPGAAAGVAAIAVGREMTQRKDVIAAMRERLAELEASATDAQLVEASRALDAVVDDSSDRT